MIDKRRPWFGPHKIGFGWGPVTWEGYLITFAVAIAFATAIRLLHHHLIAS
jgi:hypothetical protein